MEENSAWGFAAVVVQSLAAVAWPGALICVVWLLRDDLRKLLPNLSVRHGDLEFSFKRISQLVDAVQEHTVNQERLDIALPPPSDATANLQSLGDDELRLKVEDCALQMREMEQRFRQEREEDYRKEREHDWMRTTETLLKASDRHRYEWQTALLPKAVALRDELLRRLGESQSDHDFNYDHVFQGSLAGPDPLNQGALRLEQMARRLTGPAGAPKLVT